MRKEWSVYKQYFFIHCIQDLFRLGYIIEGIGDKILLIKSPKILMF